ncbi:hypothetical protein [Flaviflagellibacter deserti]|uniref:Uncharacterized protein n=1 Tax=Flaviflagellibacter deserti TaxID=2267266 RepID=A0ABV9Z1J6_9HYPH
MKRGPLEGSYILPVPAGTTVLPTYMESAEAWHFTANALDPVEIGNVVVVWLRAGGIKISRLTARAAAVVLIDREGDAVTFDRSEVVAIHRVRSIYRDL